MTNVIQAVVFDFDGLIVDTETPEFESFQEMYRQHGCELTLDIWGQCIGTGPEAFNPYDDLEARIGRAWDREAARQRHKMTYEEKMRHADVRPGVAPICRKRKNWVCASAWPQAHREHGLPVIWSVSVSFRGLIAFVRPMM